MVRIGRFDEGTGFRLMEFWDEDGVGASFRGVVAGDAFSGVVAPTDDEAAVLKSLASVRLECRSTGGSKFSGAQSNSLILGCCCWWKSHSASAAGCTLLKPLKRSSSSSA